eukprot:CAMPEP_0179064900 /NCGR_PEP_ID=MMETSP0796-20121207/28180_1 /TAXON_ID=73915 /ORGANISM="Pyrodinium bahamense, Strain pbaha01" /LENGTH=268 /DNA_ID=CAMNT_0020761849 /DNA_START=404 /DNA_END=1208 /DNA_ORIENTATION=+
MIGPRGTRHQHHGPCLRWGREAIARIPELCDPVACPVLRRRVHAAVVGPGPVAEALVAQLQTLLDRRAAGDVGVDTMAVLEAVAGVQLRRVLADLTGLCQVEERPSGAVQIASRALARIDPPKRGKAPEPVVHFAPRSEAGLRPPESLGDPEVLAVEGRLAELGVRVAIEAGEGQLGLPASEDFVQCLEPTTEGCRHSLQRSSPALQQDQGVVGIVEICPNTAASLCPAFMADAMQRAQQARTSTAEGRAIPPASALADMERRGEGLH